MKRISNYLIHYIAIILAQFGLFLKKKTSDRYVLEKIIFPYFSGNDEYSNILFVGCDWFTKHYEQSFLGKNFWTIDNDKKKCHFGAKNHIHDHLQNLIKYFHPEFFDIIICNGVFGWGINSREQIEYAFITCHKVLREEGILVIGWNDIPPRVPAFFLQERQDVCFFKPYVFPPLKSHQFLANPINRHIFTFYQKA
jgi:hypothetical protein